MAQPISFGSSKGFSLLQNCLAGEQIWAESPAWQVVPVETRRRPPIRDVDIEAAALRHGLVFDQSDICHAQ
jgi:hypothetical protein